MKHADIAFHAGFGSLSRFNAALRKTFQQSPKEIRNSGKSSHGPTVRVRLAVRGPYDFDWMFAYLHRRALAGVESVTGESGSWCYVRRLPDGAEVRVSLHKDQFVADLPIMAEPLHSLLTRIRRVFDLNADGDAIHEHLLLDPLLSEWVKATPGLRVPGAWDGFETAVRAVLGQQVSVERGTDLANKMIELYGDGLFPTPEGLIDRDIAEIGMPGQRGRAIETLARAVVSGDLQLDDCQDYDEVQVGLQTIAGIGPWTANYVRMRVLKDPNAFPDNDWVVMKALDCTATQARKRAESWQPWRAYGLMYLWFASKTLRARQEESQ